MKEAGKGRVFQSVFLERLQLPLITAERTMGLQVERSSLLQTALWPRVMCECHYFLLGTSNVYQFIIVAP